MFYRKNKREETLETNQIGNRQTALKNMGRLLPSQGNRAGRVSQHQVIRTWCFRESSGVTFWICINAGCSETSLSYRWYTAHSNTGCDARIYDRPYLRIKQSASQRRNGYKESFFLYMRLAKLQRMFFLSAELPQVWMSLTFVFQIVLFFPVINLATQN